MVFMAGGNHALSAVFRASRRLGREATARHQFVQRYNQFGDFRLDEGRYSIRA